MPLSNAEISSGVLHDVLTEVKRAHLLHAGHSLFSSRSKPEFCYLVLAEEVGEVANALLNQDEDNLILELTQVAAMALTWLEVLHAS